ncbi:MAG: ABC transporter permease [Lachnospiraceae bacterium]|nr:ABC transporter permease [Lachnospiraceae bacterium]
MNGFLTYLYIQLRRAVKLLPVMMTVTLLVCGCVGAFAVLYLGTEMAGQNKKYRIAVVGDTTDSYLGFGISALSVLDDSRFMVDFPSMTEEEARRELAAGKITAYAKVPDGLVESIVEGSNDKPIVFVTATGSKVITGFLVEELTEEASSLVVRSQSAIYGMQRILWDNGMGDLWWEATESLNLRLLDMVLNRTKLCGLEFQGMANGLSTEGYYFCSMLIFFLLLAGINSSPLFAKKSRELMKLLAARGVSIYEQIAGEYLAYLFLNLCCLLGVFLVLVPVFKSGVIQLAEWEKMGVEILAGFYVRMIPVVAVLTAMQFLLYELVTGVVNGILLQFICCISMAYLSGCFYPAGMFPDILKRIGEGLPTGVVLRYADEGLMGERTLGIGFGLLIYLAVFLGVSMFARSLRIQRG